MGAEEQPWSTFITLCDECGGCTLIDPMGSNENENKEKNACKPCSKFAQLTQIWEKKTEEAIERHTRETNTRFGNAMAALHQELAKKIADKEKSAETVIKDLEMRLTQTMNRLEELRLNKAGTQSGSQMKEGGEEKREKETDHQASPKDTESQGTRNNKSQLSEEPAGLRATEQQRRVLVVGDSNVSRFKRTYLKKMSKDKRVEVRAIPGKGISEVGEVVEAARPDNNTMVIIHAGLNDCLNLRPLHETMTDIEEMAKKYPGTAIQVCTQPETPEMGMVALENLRELNQGLEKLCSGHPENLELVDLRWTKEKLKYPFNKQHYTEAASEAVGDQLAKRTRAFLARGKRERTDPAARTRHGERGRNTPERRHWKQPPTYAQTLGTQEEALYLV